jgi:uncharacterized membrane protein (DUF485 family)
MTNDVQIKEVGLSLLLGSGVVVLTPIIAGLVSGIGFMATEIIPNVLSIGEAISAGVAAFATSWVIAKYLR